MSANVSQIETKLVRGTEDFLAAARLRYDVFVTELGGAGSSVDHKQKLDRDQFDGFADHLLAIDPAADGKVVGAYRLLTSEMAERAGGFYSEGEYDLARLKTSGRKLLELGRSCVHRDYRHGTAMFQLWQGLASYVERHAIEVMFGVASFHGTDPARYGQALSNLAANYRAPDELCPVSKRPEPMQIIAPDQINRSQAIKETPALIKSYLRLGGVVGDGAFIDCAFNTVDVCLVMDTEKMSLKHKELYARATTR